MNRYFLTLIIFASTTLSLTKDNFFEQLKCTLCYTVASQKVSGTVHLMPHHGMIYAGPLRYETGELSTAGWIMKILGEKREVKPEEPLVPVIFHSEGEGYWGQWHMPPLLEKTADGERILLSFLPLSILDGLKEGDVICLTINGVPVQLKAATFFSDNPSRSFSSDLEELKKSFAENPNYCILHTKFLQEKSIIVEEKDGKEGTIFSKVNHGPNGFKYYPTT